VAQRRASAGRGAATPRGVTARLGGSGRRGWLLLVLVVVFLTFGVPRWLLNGDATPGGSHAGQSFAQLCREHGGRPATDATGQRCTVRYGPHVYLMDAITPAGFDEDTARYQRKGCELARREEGPLTAPGHRPRAFVYHPLTGVCERRP
jgi:hypothetical protein